MTELNDLPTLGSVERRAKEILHPAVWAFGYYGSYSGQTFDRNRRALDQLAIEQRVVVDVRNIDTSVQFFGRTLPSPIVVCPMGGMVSFHEMGDVEIARGAGMSGNLSVVSGRSAFTPDHVAREATGPLIYQLYYAGNREWLAERLRLVQECGGYCAVTVTVTVASHGQRDDAVEIGKLPPTKYQPEMLPDRYQNASLSWPDIAWLRQQIKLPFGLKGVFTVEDALISLDHGLDYIWISNHGGRQLDGGRAAIDVLPEIAEVVKGRVPIIVDGGFKRGADIIKGLALGADLIGMARTPLWGLSVAGAEGVHHVLALLDHELKANLALCGQTCIGKLTPKLIRKVDY